MAFKKQCIVCKTDYESVQPHSIFCSVGCRNQNGQERWGRTGDNSIPTGTVGAISEILVSAYLMKRGYSVFRALSPSCMCDLIIFKDNIFNRIEVRTGYKSLVTGNISFPGKDTDIGKQDMFAIYIRASDEVLFFDSKKNPIEI